MITSCPSTGTARDPGSVVVEPCESRAVLTWSFHFGHQKALRFQSNISEVHFLVGTMQSWVWICHCTLQKWYQRRPQTVQVNQLNQIALSTTLFLGFFSTVYFCTSRVNFCSLKVYLYFESILLYLESIPLYFESIPLYFESIFLYFESTFVYFESILLYFQSILLYFESIL